LYLGGAGLTGLGAYLYLGGSPAPFSTSSPSKPKQKQERSALDPERFLDLKLKAIEPYNHNTSRFIFELPDGGAALSPITSLVVVRASEGSPDAPVDKKGDLAVRAYTPISSPDQEGELVLLIKKYENGVISKYVHERLKPNDTLAIKGPITKFPYKSTLRHYPHLPLPPICQTIKRELPLVPFSSFHSLFLTRPGHGGRPRA
jgi:cytochrome-b5 reductase